MIRTVSPSPSPSPRTQARRLDALLALPLARFRRVLADLSADELAALGARITVQRVRSRWARGGHGIARHRVPNELGLLARREAAVRLERDARLAAAAAPVRLLTHSGTAPELAAPMLEEQVA